MITQINNFDSSFFSVKIDGILEKSEASAYLTDKVISFQVTEEMGKMITGTLLLEEDESFRTSLSLRRFRKIEIQWGYKNKEQVQKDAYAKIKNSKELFTPMQATRVAKGYIQNPSWQSGQDGKMMYSCSFICFETPWMVTGNSFFSSGSRLVVIQQTLLQMGIVLSFVKFKRMQEILTYDTGIRRDNTSGFRFLNRLALEWQCLFRIAYDKMGNAVALFCDYTDEVSIMQFINLVGGCTGLSVLWEYKSGMRNVLSYNAQYNQAEGSGDNVVPMMINGQVTFQRYNAQTEKVQYFTLNSEMMSKEMKSSAAQTELFRDWVGRKSWDDTGINGKAVSKYFKAMDDKTAPQGIGFTVSMEVIGNPLCTAPARAKFGKGFPAILGTEGTMFYQTSVTHRIDKSGYKMSLTIVDAFTLTQGTMVG
jgi:hypothetical protein